MSLLNMFRKAENEVGVLEKVLKPVVEKIVEPVEQVAQKVEVDLQNVFKDFKQKSIEANLDVEQAKQALAEATKRAADWADQAKKAAIAASEKATADAKMLMSEAEFHDKIAAAHKSEIDTTTITSTEPYNGN
jgi:hypothetical protein